MATVWCMTVLALMPSASAISLLGIPLASRASTADSRVVSPHGFVAGSGNSPGTASGAARAARADSISAHSSARVIANPACAASADGPHPSPGVRMGRGRHLGGVA